MKHILTTSLLLLLTAATHAQAVIDGGDDTTYPFCGKYVEDVTQRADSEGNNYTASTTGVTISCFDAENDSVLISGIFMGVASLKGHYDKATNIIDCGAQRFKYDDTYGAYMAMGRNDDNVVSDLSFKVVCDDNGHYSLQLQQGGWVIEVIKYEGEDTQMKVFAYADDCTLHKCNYVMEYAERHINDDNTSWTSWAKIDQYVYLEDLGTQHRVHGFADRCVFTYDVNGSNITIPNGQVTQYNRNYDFTFWTYNLSYDGTYIQPVMDDKYRPDANFTLPGYISSQSGIVVFGTYDNGSVSWHYLYNAHGVDSESIAINNLYTQIMIIPKDYYEGASAISPVTVTPQHANNATGTYSISGQRIQENSNYKGIVIKNGRKVVVR